MTPQSFCRASPGSAYLDNDTGNGARWLCFIRNLHHGNSHAFWTLGRPRPRSHVDARRRFVVGDVCIVAEINRCWRLYKPTRVTYSLRPSRPATPGLSQGAEAPWRPSTDIVGPRR